MNFITQQSPVIRIREMCESDLNQIILIEREIFLFPWSLENFADSIKSDYLCKTMVENNSIVGYTVIMMAPDEAHILTLGIAAQRQRKGLGEKLLKYVIQISRERGVKSVLLDVRESNQGAARLYKQLGFRQIATRKGYYPAMCGREDALIMRLML